MCGRTTSYLHRAPGTEITSSLWCRHRVSARFGRHHPGDATSLVHAISTYLALFAVVLAQVTMPFGKRGAGRLDFGEDG